MSNLQKHLGRIRRFVDGSKENANYSTLFASKHGKKLGCQLSDLMGFVAAMNYMSIPVALLQQEWIRIWKEGQLEELKKYATTTNGFEEMELLLKVMATLSEQEEYHDPSRVFGRREMRRLLALLTLSTSGYLDSYLLEVASSVRDSKLLRGTVEKYVATNVIMNRRDLTGVTSFEHVWRLGSNQLVETLYESFKVEEMCSSHFTDTEARRYRRFLSFFIQLRGKIAHGDPEPSFRRFDHEFFVEIREMLRSSIAGQWKQEDVPKPLHNMIGIFQKWFRNNLSTISVVYVIPLLVVLPICLLDVVVEHLRE